MEVAGETRYVINVLGPDCRIISSCQCDHSLNLFFTFPSTQITVIIKMASQPPQEPASQADAAQNPQQAEEETGYAPLVDPRLPTRKDTSLREFLSKIDDYAPIVRIPFLLPFTVFPALWTRVSS